VKAAARLALGALAVLGPAAAASAQPANRPAVRPVALRPLAVGGAHFRAGESVLVVVLGGAHASGRVTASPDGTWTLRFPAVDASGRPLSIRAHGDRGSAALWWPRVARPTAHS
jgi:hypothetical protein